MREWGERGGGEPRGVDPGRAGRLLLYAALFELSLGGLAFLLGLFFGINPAEKLEATPSSVLLGLGATVPLGALFLLFLRLDNPSFRRIRRLLSRLLRPLAPALTLPTALLLGAAAGIGEELLFRGFLQEGLTSLIGIAPGLLLASIIFGLLHSVTPVYAAFATLLGALLGFLYISAGSLLPSLLAHALYDAFGLLMLRREIEKG